MLWRIIQAHGGSLPDDVHVTFANTGKEREETLRFVHEVGAQWGVVITWVEWRDTDEGFEVVGYNSASRKGEPFEALIKKKKRLPNWQERWCTGFLKVATMHAYLRSLGLEIGSFTEVIGLRADEGARILRGQVRAESDKRLVRYPLGETRVMKSDVMTFWAAQPFDLQLQPHEGNCDLCFLKGKGLRKRLIRDVPDVSDWWNRMEVEQEGFFDRRDTVAKLVSEVSESPELFDWDDGPGYDTECSDVCGGDTAEDVEILNRLYLRRLDAA